MNKDYKMAKFVNINGKYIAYTNDSELITLLNNETDRLNNDIKELLKENENKEKVIIKQDNIINELETQLNDLRQVAFIKYNSNEWNNCLSFNDDIKPILDKLKELKGE